MAPFVINSALEYLNYVASEKCEHINAFRGHGDAEWKLLPSISRLKNPTKCGSLHLTSWQDVEDHLLGSFKSQSAPYMNFVPENKLEWLIHAQHHGLPTVLLDWTTNPLKGLFFAVDNPKLDNVDGAVFLGCMESYYLSASTVGEKISKIICFHSKHINGRLIAQEGCFTAFPIPEKWNRFINLDEISTYEDSDLYLMEKVIIPAGKKNAIRAELNKFGITHRSLFPGLDGVAMSIRMGFE